MKHEYAIDSAGSGQWRGGLGVETIVKFYGEQTKGVIFGDGLDEESRAFGLFGGAEGHINEMAFDFPDGTQHIPKSKEILPDIPTGTLMRQLAGGGGGYGHPSLRPAGLVAKEVRNGVISLGEAREKYGVVLDPATFEVNRDESESIRRGMRGKS